MANTSPGYGITIRVNGAVVATGRSDQPNQSIMYWYFQEFLRALDANITKITDQMLILAAEAIASCVSDEQLNANFIVPCVFDVNAVQKVATAVKGL